jgi:hypothetical protein
LAEQEERRDCPGQKQGQPEELNPNAGARGHRASDGSKVLEGNRGRRSNGPAERVVAEWRSTALVGRFAGFSLTPESAQQFRARLARAQGTIGLEPFFRHEGTRSTPRTARARGPSA